VLDLYQSYLSLFSLFHAGQAAIKLPSAEASKTYINLYLLIYFLFFCSRYFKDRLTDLYQLFHEDGKMGCSRKVNLVVF